jgi:hypothetical protein
VVNRRWSRLVAGLVCILALVVLAPQVARTEEDVAAVVEAAVAVETPVPVTSADLPWLDDGAVQSAPPAGALEGALFLGQVPTHSCPYTCTSVDCPSFCASQGGAGVCRNGCCTCQ